MIVYRITKADRTRLAELLKAAGIKARIRNFPLCARVVFEGTWQPVAEVLNSNGFLAAAGATWEWSTFQGQQAFVYYTRNS